MDTLTPAVDSTPGVRRIGGALAAEIFDMDLEHLDDRQFKRIYDAWIEHHVLLLRRQNVTANGLAAFAARFGRMNVFPESPGKFARAQEHPDVIVLRNAGNARAYTGYWHSDASSWEEPPATTILCARKLPIAGGDTAFANQHLAFESLSDGMQAMLLGLKAVHHKEYEGHNRKYMVHPVVRRHPVTGRSALYVNRSFVTHFAGMTAEESAPILEYLYRHMTRAEFCYRHLWREGDVLVWDNRSVLHRAIHDFGNDPDARMMHHTESGCEPVLAA